VGQDAQNRSSLFLDDKRAVAGGIDLEVRASISAVDETSVGCSAMESVERD